MAIKTYKDRTPFTGVIGRTTEESSPAWPEPPRASEGAPSLLIFGAVGAHAGGGAP